MVNLFIIIILVLIINTFLGSLAFYLVTKRLSVGQLLISIPIGLFIALITLLFSIGEILEKLDDVTIIERE